MAALKHLIVIAILGFVVWQGYTRYESRRTAQAVSQSIVESEEPASRAAPRPEAATSYTCDGRIYCSQMTSCAEAKYFLQHCPNVKMDGDRDGIPCEQQWCK